MRLGLGQVTNRQALGRLPWLAFFFLRPRRLLPRLAMVRISLIQDFPRFRHSKVGPRGPPQLCDTRVDLGVLCPATERTLDIWPCIWR